MAKHAYLIMANENFSQLKLLLEVLDHNDNDLFLHIDAKSGEYDRKSLENAVCRGRLFIVENPISVFWGGYSIIKAEIMLLEYALKTDSYAYYHLVSGKDMPLKTQGEMHEFFERNNGMEFLRIGVHHRFNYEFRYRYYYRWVDKTSENARSRLTITRLILSSLWQMLRGIDRTENASGIEFKKGSQWFSITDSFARYVVSKKQWIEDTFKDTYCCDEIFMQTLIKNSDFEKNLFYLNDGDEASCNLRKIDWSRGRPYTFRMGDREEILDSELLFIRKVDEKVDAELVWFLHDRLVGKR